MMMKELYKKLSSAALLLWFCSSMAMAQDRTVSGKIVDESGQPLPGVNVLVKGTSTGTVSDGDGAYSLGGVNDNSVLVFSFIGYLAKEVTVGSRTVVDVDMTPDITSLDEVVVIGYGEQKKALLTGANIHQDGAQLQALNTSSAMEALQGITPGVSIQRNSGQPGAGTKVRIRGIGTIGNSNPLYIVDGVPVGYDINYLAPSDIESIDVLKDAASAAIYGARGANGVVLVTTRRGKQGSKTQISYNGYVGVQNIYKKPPTLNAQEYMFIMDEGRTNDGLTPTNWEAEIKNNTWLNNQQTGLGTQYGQYVWDKLQSGWKGTDWVDEITQKNAPVSSHAFNITGATEDFTYGAGFSYIDQTGMIGGDIIDAGMKRLTARINTEIKLWEIGGRKILKIGENFTLTNSQVRGTGTGTIYWNDLHDGLVINPLMPAYYEFSPSEYKFAPTLEGVNLGQANPIATMFYRHNFNWGKGNNLIGNGYAELEPIKGLKIRSSYGINSWFGHSRSFAPAYGLSSQYNRPESAVSVGQSAYQGAASTWTTTVSYGRSFGDHNLQAMIGNEQIKNILGFNVGGSRLKPLYSNPDYGYLDNTAPATSISDLSVWGRDGAANGGGIFSYFGRLSYNYQERYMLDFTARRDGSGNFYGDKKYGNFFAVSGGWNFMEEEFMSSLDNIFDYGKLRVSWGQNGNEDVGVPFSYQTNIEPVAQGYYFGSNKLSSATTYIPKNTPNPNIGWETSEQFDIGLDAAFLNSRLSVTLDWYQKLTKDWLVQAPALGTAGADAPWINGGEVKNTGVEFAFAWKDKVGDVQYGVTLSGATTRNEVVELSNAEKTYNGPANVLSQGTAFVSRVQVGKPIGYFYGFETAGILQNQAEVDAYVGPEGDPMQFDDNNGLRPGDVRFVDQNNDGRIDESDKVFLGNAIPDFELGLQLNASWKGVYANVTFAGKFGHQIMRSYRSFADQFEQNYTTEIFGRWHGEGTSSRIPRLSATSHRNQQYISDIYMYDGDFVRINNLTVGYDFGAIAKKVGFFSGAQVYMTVNNLHTFTKYDGMDPEVAYGGEAAWASGIDLGLYPLPRTVMLGVNLTF
ncbi:SusC/RagA family TonB-linked outer membrane protein [Pseudochryseolinea flava]|uniref:SusC/RagA family TonB-linked outer membrane protein n=1 Tax=Pseudochryseolinea flava TaxID=2059302 RepID=A0A364Y5C2_9BACT|nr:TonB-dependent receptor [Pseudochryseolinea flava]RAW02153.1 SusC/RagA family TonB-linked outer membrane protein [Pseudochryseolinea flava]